MFLSFTYWYLIKAILLLVNVIYNIYCIIGLIRFKKRLTRDGYELVRDEGWKFNIYLLLIKWSLKHYSGSKAISKGKRRVNATNMTLTLSTLTNFVTLIIYIAVVVISYMVYIQLSNIPNLLTTIFNKSDCICYVKCTGNEEDDTKTAYELLFGPDEYNKLCQALNLMPEDKEMLESIHNNNPSGKTEGEFIIRHLNDDAVLCYKAIVGNNNKFRSKDGKDRTKMTNEELKEDLRLLLADYKVNGRNTNCEECRETIEEHLKSKCIGEAHWVQGWTWDQIWDSDDNGGGSSAGSHGVIAAENSPYGIELDDGWYFWYHQTDNCKCDSNVLHETYGRYGDVWLISDSAGARGCSSYSTAMALSNVLGMEITPYELLLDVFGGTITIQSNGRYGYNDEGSAYIKYTGGPIMYMQALATKLQDYYYDQGLRTEVITMTQENIDAILEKGGYIVDSWYHGMPWYHPNDYEAGSHFMVIRKKDADGNYYCLNSAVRDTAARDNMTTPCSWDKLNSRKVHNYGVAYWNENPTPSGGGSGGIVPSPMEIGDPDIQADIANGLYTAEDYNYLVALGGESNTYEGFYAVACSVRNRVNKKGTSYKAEVTANGQFAGFNPSEIGNPRNADVKRAAVAVLRGGPSTVGNCIFFFGRRNGHDMWANADCPEFYNIGGNIYYQSWGQLHNTGIFNGNGILIWKSSEAKWYYPSGTYYKQ